MKNAYLLTVKTLLSQETFLPGHPAKELKNRIVSLPQPYVRPIKRWQENKPVELEMKVHMLQVDGISFSYVKLTWQAELKPRKKAKNNP